jgi:DNA-binding NarL/FixJ family response regulator
VREGLRTFLDLQDGIEVVGEAADGRQAVDEAERLRPDVVLMDLLMPRLDGVEAMRELRSRVPGARAVVLTSFLDEERLLPALRAGAAGYLLKNVERASSRARSGSPPRARRSSIPRSQRGSWTRSATSGRPSSASSPLVSRRCSS